MRRISHIDALRRSSLISLTFGDLGGGADGDLGFLGLSNFKELPSGGDASLSDLDEGEHHPLGASASGGGTGQPWQGFEAFQQVQLAQLQLQQQQQQQLSMLTQMNHNMCASLPGFGFEDMSGFAPIDEHGLTSRSSLFNPAFMGNLSKLVPNLAAVSAQAAAAPAKAAPRKRKSDAEGGAAGKKGKGEEAAPSSLVSPSNASKAQLNKAPHVKVETESGKSKAKLNLNGGITGAAPMMGVRLAAAKGDHGHQYAHISEQLTMQQQHLQQGLYPSQHLHMQQMHLQVPQQPQTSLPPQAAPKRKKINKAAEAAAEGDTGAGEKKDKRTRTQSSQYRGVSKCTKDGRWQARIRVGSTVKYLGRFIVEEDAARCYDAAAATLHGERAQYNFGAPLGAEAKSEPKVKSEPIAAAS
jgi:hypothetical protein